MKDYTTQIMSKLNGMEKIIIERQTVEKRTEFASILVTLLSSNFVLFPLVKSSNVLIELFGFSNK